jgi:hypothetical protein
MFEWGQSKISAGCEKVTPTPFLRIGIITSSRERVMSDPRGRQFFMHPCPTNIPQQTA